MAKVRIKLNSRNIKALLQSSEVVADLGERAQRMADAAQAAAGDYPLVRSYSDDDTPRARAAVVVFGQRTEQARSSAATLLLTSLDAAR